MTPTEFVARIRAMSFDNCFNPYADVCPYVDREDAPSRRVRLLEASLRSACNKPVDSLWVGRDLGYRGGRRTGLAFTDDTHIQVHAERWGVKVSRATKGQVVSERTAGVIWDMLSVVATPIFLWNVFPLHPHPADRALANRNHTCKERDEGLAILDELIRMLNPQKIIAVGNDAEAASSRVAAGRDLRKVRHPSYGGQVIFRQQVRQIYRVTERQEQGSLLEKSSGVA